MRLENSITLTDNLDTSSAGASATGFIKRCSLGRLGRLETEDAARHVFLPIHEGTGGPSLLVGLHLFGTTDEWNIPERLFARLLCHALLQRLPDEALPEAMESLREMYDFYKVPRLASEPALPAASRPAGWGETTIAKAVPVEED